MNAMKWRMGTWILAGLIVSARAANAMPVVRYEADSLYNHIVVKDDDRQRTLYFNSYPQTILNLDDPNQGGFEYCNYFHTAFAFNPAIKNVLVLGLGGGTTQRTLQLFWPDVKVTTVDIDPAVARVSRDWFNTLETPRHKIYIEDGRRFLKQSKEKYDAIFLDAYLADYMGSYVPFHLATREFFQLVRDHLNDNGIVGYNVIGQVTGWQQVVVRSMYKTMQDTFGPMYIFPAETSMNVVLIGSKSGKVPTLTELATQARAMMKTGKVKMPEFFYYVSRGIRATPDLGDVPVLRDDFAPVESLNLRYWKAEPF